MKSNKVIWVKVYFTIVFCLVIIGGCQSRPVYTQTLVSTLSPTPASTITSTPNPTPTDNITTEATPTSILNPTSTIIPTPENTIWEFELPQGCRGRFDKDRPWVSYRCDSSYQVSDLNTGLWLENIEDGSKYLLVESDESIIKSYSWSPDNSMILSWKAYHGYLNLHNVDNLLAGGKTIYESSSLFLENPRWSPDSKHIALIDPAPGITLSIIKPTGEIELFIDKDEAPWFIAKGNWSVLWSTDSKYLAYPSVSNWRYPHQTQIWILDIESGKQKLIFESDDIWFRWQDIDWSPDSQYLTFTGLTGKENPRQEPYYGQLWKLNIETAELTKLYETENNPIYEPKWSPDGNLIVIEGPIMQTNDDYKNHLITVFDLLSDDYHQIDFTPFGKYNWAKVLFSPDTQYLIIERDDIWLFELSSRTLRKIGSGLTNMLCWSDEDHLIYMYDYSNDKHVIKLVPIK